MQIQEEFIRDLDTCLTDYERDLCEGLLTKEELFTLSGFIRLYQAFRRVNRLGLMVFRLNFIPLSRTTLVILCSRFLMNVITPVR